MSRKRPPPDRAGPTRWVHVFEEDTGDAAVYRPEHADIPLSRRPREQLVLDANGQGTLFAGGADDRLSGRAVSWRDANDPGTTRDGAADVQIIDRSPDRLVVRIRGT
jgi:hypothetical protein